MSRQKVPVTFTFKRNETNPPVYIAGSFSDPPWQPQEMEASVDQHGEYTFTKTVTVDGGSEIQYKFRIGPGDWWALDEDADKVTDEFGNTNNVLKVSIDEPQETASKAPNPQVTELKDDDANSGTQTPDMAKTAAEVADSARDLDPDTPEPELSNEEAGRIGARRMSTTPIDQVAETSMEVADVAATLDSDELTSDDSASGENSACPVFSHESVGPACEDEEASHHDDHDKGGLDNLSHSESSNPAIEVENMDFDDPQLEEFPSNSRDSIIAAVRRISTSIDADRTVVEGIPPSPIISSLQHPKTVSSLDDSDEPLSPSVDASPEDKQGHRADNNPKQSRSGARPPSMSSLGSIVEDEEQHDDSAAGNVENTETPFVQHPGPSWGAANERAVSDDSSDEGIAMRVDSKLRNGDAPISSPQPASAPTALSSNGSEVAESHPNESAPTAENEPSVPHHDDNDNAPAPTEGGSPTDDPATAPRSVSSTHAGDSPNVENASEEEKAPTLTDPTSQSGLRKRAANKPSTPPSTHHFQNPKNFPEWLEACLRLVFVKWIGGLAFWLHSRRHRVLMAAGTAAIVVGVGLLWHNPVRV